jgi:uncharacterized membrane protein
MQTTIKKELPVIAIVLIPFAYLAVIWNSLPQQVPMHWNASGQIDRYGDKAETLIIPFLLPVLTYLIFTFSPRIDPRGKIAKMGDKLHGLKFMVTLLMSALAVYILYAMKSGAGQDNNYLILFIGVLYMVMGNYFKTIQANYFIGIRTPWTLENETVWKETHKMAGMLWFVGGLAIVGASFVLEPGIMMVVFLCITAVIALVPIGFSYIKFRKLAGN